MNPRAILVLFSLSGALPALAAEPAASPRTLDDCYRAALARNETIAAQKELVIQARENVKQAVGAVLPSVSAIGSWVKQESPGSGTLQQSFAPTTQTTARITGTQPIFHGAREWAALAQLKRLRNASEQAEKQAEIQLWRDVAAAFYGVLAVERDIQILAEELKAYDGRIAELEQFERIGRSRTSEVLTAKAGRASFEASQIQAQGAVSQARETLALLTGLPADTPLADENGELSQPEPLDAWLKAVEERPDVAAARERLEAAKSGQWVATGALLPGLDLIGNYYLKRPGLLDNVHWDAQLALTIPIFTGGQTLSRIREAKSVRRQTEDDLSLTRRAAAADIRTLHARLSADWGQTKALASAVQLAQASYDDQVQEYREGLVTNIDVLTALNTLQDMKRALDHSRYLARTDLAQLEAASARMKPVKAEARRGVSASADNSGGVQTPR